MKRQCRSVHLGYKSDPASWAYLEVIPKKSAPGTYFCALGFQQGYFGMQELSNGKKVIIFSVWDKARKGHDDRKPNEIPEEERVGVIMIGDGVRVGRFGGEGTGSQSFYDYDWEIDKPVKFAVNAEVKGEFTVFRGYFYHEQKQEWQLMASFRGELGTPLKGLYSFIEDFRRNFESAKISRVCEFQNPWVMVNDTWVPIRKAKFTGDVTPSTNIDAGPSGKRGFFLATGGDTEMKTTKLWSMMELPETEQSKPSVADELAELK